MVLMFIGAAPGSTGGGIKVTTFAVVVMTVISVLRGREDTIIRRRKVAKQAVYKAIAVMLSALVAVCFCAGIIYSTHPVSDGINGLDSFFEAVSAFATVGLSAGVSGVANLPSRLVLCLTMFLGRVGPVSLALSLAMRAPSDLNTVIPEAKIIVG
jgi:trk system potassium uptake protein TrkH